MVPVKPMSAGTVITSPALSTRQRRSRGGTQPLPLTRDDILDAALPLVANLGLEALTVIHCVGPRMRALYEALPARQRGHQNRGRRRQAPIVRKPTFHAASSARGRPCVAPSSSLTST